MEHRMLCLDNSEWMRNGDFNPTRMKAQRDAANILCTRHLGANPENTVGIMTLAGPRCTIHSTQCSDRPKLHRALSLDNTPIGGRCRLVNGIKIARLALKNRQNQKGEARIVLFVGSPIADELKVFRRLGAQLKKNSCGISVILLGEVEDNRAKMEALVEAARKEDGQTCDLIVVPPGVTPLEVVRSSPLCSTRPAGGSGTTGTTGGNAAPAGGGDDQLQEALRLSLLEAQGNASNSGGDVPAEALTEEEQINRAIALSMGMGAPAPATEEGDGAAATTNEDEDEDEDEDDDDEAAMIAQALALSEAQDGADEDPDIAAAIAASMAEDDDDAAVQSTPSTAEDPGLPSSDGGFSNPDYVKNLLASVPGASIDDPLIQSALAEAQKIQQGEDDEGADGDDKSDDKD